MTVEYLDAKRVQGLSVNRTCYATGTSNENMDYSPRYVTGQWIKSGNSKIGTVVTGLSFYLKLTSGSASGTLTAEIIPKGSGWDGTGSTKGTPVEFGSMNVSSLTSSHARYDFSNGTTHTLAEGDVIAIEMSTNGGQLIGVQCASPSAMSNEEQNNYDGSWTAVSSVDTNYCLQTASDKATLVTPAEADGYAIFDGSGDYATAGSVSNFNFLHDGSPFSVSFWAYRNGSPSSGEPQFFGTMGASADDKGLGAYMETDGDIIVMYGGGSFASTTAVNIPDATWTHITITQSGTSLKWYKNGDLQSTISTTGGSGNADYILNFARNPHGSGTVLNCRISDFGIWEDHVLSDDDIDKLSGTNGQSVTRITDDGTGFDYSSSNIVHHWTFFTDYTDSKGSLNGTASGDPTFSSTSAPTATSASSNLQENTIFNETDTYRQFWLQDNTGISKSGCLGFWQFQEQSGAVINHATIANGFPDGLGSAADGVIDAGLKRDAVGKFRPYAYEWLDGGVLSVDVPDQTALDITGDITITMWIYPTEDYTSNGRVFMAKRDGTTTTTYQLFWHSSNLLSYYNGTTYNGTMNASGPMTLDAWNFIAITISSNTLTIYLNGYNLGTHTVGTRNTNSAPLTFGQTSLNNDEEYAGRIQDSTIWNRALSEAEITAMYNSNRGVIDMVSGVGWYY